MYDFINFIFLVFGSDEIARRQREGKVLKRHRVNSSMK